jgi:hypothetical protein
MNHSEAAVDFPAASIFTGFARFVVFQPLIPGSSSDPKGL